MAVARFASALQSLREKPRRLLAVFAHPDDESYGCSGALARAAADPDTATVLLCMTRGEASSMGPKRGLSPGEVGDLREGRLARVADILSLDGLIIGDLPDGRVAHLPLEDGAAPIREVLDAFAPQVVITHDPRGVNAHADHIAVHWLMRHALVGRPATRLAMVAYTAAASEAASPRLLFPTPESDIDARLHLTEAEIAAKEACLRVHEALVTLSADGPAELIRRPPIENYAFLGEARLGSLEASGEDLFKNLA